MHRWIQIPLMRSIKLKESKDMTVGSCHSYSCSRTGNKMVEYYVDSSSKFHKEINEQSIYGGNLSVKKSRREATRNIWARRVYIQTICTYK